MADSPSAQHRLASEQYVCLYAAMPLCRYGWSKDLEVSFFTKADRSLWSDSGHFGPALISAVHSAKSDLGVTHVWGDVPYVPNVSTRSK